MGHISQTSFTPKTRGYIIYLFIGVLIFIALDTICCTFFALRQSGSLDPWFGKINGEQDEESIDERFGDEITADESNQSEQSDINLFDDDFYIDDVICDLYNDDEYDGDYDDKTPEHIESLIDNVKLKKYLNKKRDSKKKLRIFVSEIDEYGKELNVAFNKSISK